MSYSDSSEVSAAKIYGPPTEMEESEFFLNLRVHAVCDLGVKKYPSDSTLRKIFTEEIRLFEKFRLIPQF